MAHTKIYQIFYDKKSKLALDPAFIPLDNTANLRPDWYEFWVIRNFLKSHPLNEDHLYGFLSPSFRAKTGIDGLSLVRFLTKIPSEIEVVLFSSNWDQIAYFRNVFEQGEYWHPGLMKSSSLFFSYIGIGLDLKSFLGHSINSVFSNYFVAKPKFWREWLNIAESLWSLCEDQACEMSRMLNSFGNYFSGGQEAALKVFVQERIAPLLLASKPFQTIALDRSHILPVWPTLFTDDIRTRKLLMACDTLKLEAVCSKDNFFIEAYQKSRSAIDFLG